MGNPKATKERLDLQLGREIETSLSYKLSENTGTLTLEQVANSNGFKQLWRKVS